MHHHDLELYGVFSTHRSVITMAHIQAIVVTHIHTLIWLSNAITMSSLFAACIQDAIGVCWYALLGTGVKATRPLVILECRRKRDWGLYKPREHCRGVLVQELGELVV